MHNLSHTCTDLEELWQALDEFGFGLLTADTREGLRTRPIVPVIDRARNELTSLAEAAWLGNASAGAIDATIAFVNEFNATCLTLRGTLWVSIHDTDIAAAWTTASALRFSGGRREPGIVALRTTPHSAEYWSIAASRVRKRWRFE